MNDINQFLKDMKKKFGDNAVFQLKDKKLEKIDVIPTGSLALDLALGVGGIPKGRTTELYGLQATGKTTLCFHIIKEAQRLGDSVLFVDMENAMDIKYAKSVGVDVDNVYWNQPSSAEEALGVLEAAIASKSFGLVILDSVASLSPQQEKEDEFEKASVALTPRALSKFFRRNNYLIRENNVAVLMTNQLRDNIGSYYGGTITPGGHALRYARSVAMSMRRTTDIKQNGEVVGHTAEIDIKKNKVAPPFRTAQFDIIYGKGIDPYRDIIEVAKNLGVIQLKGSYYVYGDESLGQGKDNATESLRANEGLVEEIRERCFSKING
jgi:recombination protein RecA